MEPDSPLAALWLALRAKVSGQLGQHADAYNHQATSLAHQLHDTSDGSTYDRAKNYMGGYDFGARYPHDLDAAESLARYYQFADYLPGYVLGDEGRMSDAVGDYMENVQGLRAGGGATPPQYDGQLNDASVQWAKHHPRYARGGLAQAKECACHGH